MDLDTLTTMAGALLSSSWYRVAGLKPRLRSHARMHRHRYCGAVWFIMSDAASGRVHRFTPAARLLINGMDGERTVGQLWVLAHERLGDNAPTQDEFINLLGQLHAGDLMHCDVPPDVTELFSRALQQERVKTRQSFGNPLSIKLPLWDPDAVLNRLRPVIQPLWNRWGALAWLAVVLPAMVLVMQHWQELTSNVSDRVLASNNLMMLAILFPLIKLGHEMGHALAIKMRDGEVHDMGIMLLMLMPVPYVDGSSAATFRHKRDRALVGAAGMLVELFLAALATYLWVLAEPGPWRAVAYNVMLVAGVSTLVFNGNPLLRYDGYYILVDLIEIPNLATRANRYLGYLVERKVFKAVMNDGPHATLAERRWFVFYAPAAFIYRLIVSISIALFVAGQFFVIGVLLAIWSLFASVVLPFAKVLGHLVNSPSLARVRTRAYLITGSAVLALLFVLLLLPMPYRTQAEGVVWLPEQAIVRASDGCFLSRFLVAPGQRVSKGQPLIECTDPALSAQWRASQAKVDELQARFDALFVDDRVGAEVLREDLQRERAAQDRLRERVANLLVRSESDGRLVVPQSGDMLGRYYRKGEQLAYVIDQVRPLVRVVVAQGDIDVVRSATRQIVVRQVSLFDQVLIGRLVREVPAGDTHLPSRALTLEGGGQLAVDPRDAKGLTAMNHHFQLDVELPGSKTVAYGSRVFVRFEHEAQPLAIQWYRRLRPVFLSRFHA